ncbi:MAG: cellulase family glycosylhydrolase [Anaerolineae bacterium]|nr:cellulase family glycosylhydrolase [Anaerolineae bacterium]
MLPSRICWITIVVVAVLLLTGCTGDLAATAPCPTPLPVRPTVTQPLPTATLTPTPTTTPTPVPTISLGFLIAPKITSTVTLTAPLCTPTPIPVLWTLPGRVIPEPFGVNIHFTQPDPGEIELLDAVGFGFVRMDLFWHQVEHECQGCYDFAAYDQLVAQLSERDIRLIFILDYGNLLYGGGDAHQHDEGRAAFARFAATAARRYQGQGIIWEIWNEPNLEKFWHGPPDPLSYARLATETIAAIRRVDPTALIVGPATAGFPWEYFQALATTGLYPKLDAVTVHPYRFDEPESAWSDYAQLRTILDRASPDRKIPIIAGEWGYATVEGGRPEQQQAVYLVRQYLSHLTADVELSIWYDWRNDGLNLHDPEHNFGLVTAALVPKTSYRAAQTLIATLAGYHFQRRIPLANPADYLLLFRNHERVALAAWTIGEPHSITLPAFCDSVESIDLLGVTQTLAAVDGGLEIELTTAPGYVRWCESELLTRLALWRPVDSINLISAAGEGHVMLEVQNPFYEPVQGSFEVTVEGQVVGRQRVDAPPAQTILVSVPVSVELSRSGLIPGAVSFITPDSLPLQTAAIWLMRGD